MGTVGKTAVATLSSPYVVGPTTIATGYMTYEYGTAAKLDYNAGNTTSAAVNTKNAILSGAATALGAYGTYRGATANATTSDITVSRWGRQGLESNDWVMKGGANYPNYVLSGKWQPYDPVFRNQFAPYGSGQQFAVPPSMLEWPGGVFGVPKGVLGQRIYVGPDIPLP